MDGTVPSSHPWRSSGEKRTIWWHCDPSYQIIQYLKDMQEAIHYGLLMGEELRRRNIQKHIRNPQKRHRKLRRNRVKDTLHKTSRKLVNENPDATFVVEDLRNIRKIAKPRSRKLRTYLNRWPYAEFLRMLEYKSPNRVVKVNPGGTSSECPVCGGRVKHPTWKISRCDTCDRDYDRDRLASLAITLRGLDLCGDPFPVSAESSLPSMMDEYLYTRSMPDASGPGWTETAYVPNEMKV